jgi:hypothetical protein
LLIECLMWALLVEFLSEGIEFALLSGEAARYRACRLGFERAVHALIITSTARLGRALGYGGRVLHHFARALGRSVLGGRTGPPVEGAALFPIGFFAGNCFARAAATIRAPTPLPTPFKEP